MDEELPQGREDCPRCAALEERVRKLEAMLAEVRDRLRANSSNSSTAPSSNPLWAPRLKPKKPTGKKPGGQQGHQGHHRILLPTAEVDEVIKHHPQACEHCQAPLSKEECELASRHQVAELPKRAVKLTEHQSYSCRCGQCGRSTTEPIPPQIASRCTGEHLDAAMCFLSAFVHGSRRAVAEVVREVFGLPLSLGTLMGREGEMSDALEPAYQQVQEQVRKAPAKNVDETGWKRSGRWLWVAATKTAALFRIDRGRNWHGLQNLLGELVQGTVCSDRHGLYQRLKLERRGICWAHLKRDFQRWVDRGGSTVRLGEQGLLITAEVCGTFRRFKEGCIDRNRLLELIEPLKMRMKTLLEWGLDCGVKKALHFCRNVMKVEGALWTFTQVEGIEPTNNHAERMLRPGVIWRKKCFGSHSSGGCRYAERMLTAIQTLRLQNRSVMGFLSGTLRAHRSALPPPSLA